MGWWYWIGVSAGVGAADGVLASGVLGLWTGGLIFRAVGSLVGGAAVGYLIHLVGSGLWSDVIAGGLAGVLGCLGSSQIVAGALRRGGTRGGLAVIVAGAALLVAAIAFIPAAGYLEAVALPAVALRLRRTQPERYAGLRTLAKD